MSLIATIILGGVAGWIAGKLTGNSFSLIGNVILGVAGAIGAGFAGSLLLGADVVNGFNLGSLIAAVVGSVVVLWIARMFGGKK